MDAIINWFRNLSQKAQIAILVAVAVFTPVVGVVFSTFFGAVGAFFSLVGFILGFVKWGVAILLILGFGIYKGYCWIQQEQEQDDDDDFGWDRFR